MVKKNQTRPQKPKGPLTKAKLEKAALFYLERYSSSVEGVRRVLKRRIDKAVREERCEADEAFPWIAEIVEKLQRLGLVDDQRFAAGRVASLRRRGESARRISMKLAEKGVPQNLAQQALAEEDSEAGEEAEFLAACRFAKRKRLGPLRAPEVRDEMRQKDLASLARAGFSFDIAARVLDLDEIELVI